MGELGQRNLMPIENRNTKLIGERVDLVRLENCKSSVEFFEKELEELGKLRN